MNMTSAKYQNNATYKRKFMKCRHFLHFVKLNLYIQILHSSCLHYMNEFDIFFYFIKL